MYKASSQFCTHLFVINKPYLSSAGSAIWVSSGIERRTEVLSVAMKVTDVDCLVGVDAEGTLKL